MTSYVEIELIPPNLIRLSISLEVFAFIFNVGIFFLFVTSDYREKSGQNHK